jgi:hypothetical protein
LARDSHNLKDPDRFPFCFHPENHRSEIGHPEGAPVRPIHFDLAVGTPIRHHPKLIAWIGRPVPEVTTDRAQQNFPIIGDAARKHRCLKWLDGRVGQSESGDDFVGQAVGGDDFVLRRRWVWGQHQDQRKAKECLDPSGAWSSIFIGSHKCTSMISDIVLTHLSIAGLTKC